MVCFPQGSLDKTMDENEVAMTTMKLEHEEEISTLKSSHSTQIDQLTATFQTDTDVSISSTI